MRQQQQPQVSGPTESSFTASRCGSDRQQQVTPSFSFHAPWNCLTDNTFPLFSSYFAGHFLLILCCAVLSCFSRVWLFATLWTVLHQTPLPLGFSRQEYWSGLSCPPPGDLPDPGIKPTSLTSPALAGGFFTPNRKFKMSWISLLGGLLWVSLTHLSDP